MSTKKIYLIRHGQTDYNLQGIVQGSNVDTDLNDTGLEQSKFFFEKYKDIPFDKIYTSKLKRSQQSVALFTSLGIPTEAHEGLNEISWGNKDGHKVSVADNSYYKDILKKWSEGKFDIPIEGGESPLDVQRRQQPVWDLIKSREEEKTILICMHGRAIRILLCLLLNKNLGMMDSFEHHNLGLYILNYENNELTLELRNDLSHLHLA